MESRNLELSRELFETLSSGYPTAKLTEKQAQMYMEHFAKLLESEMPFGDLKGGIQRSIIKHPKFFPNLGEVDEDISIHREILGRHPKPQALETCLKCQGTGYRPGPLSDPENPDSNRKYVRCECRDGVAA